MEIWKRSCWTHSPLVSGPSVWSDFNHESSVSLPQHGTKDNYVDRKTDSLNNEVDKILVGGANERLKC